VGGDLSNIMKVLGEGVYIHRKAWEYALCILGLHQFDVVHSESRAISVGAGYERPLFYFANLIGEMVATDLYDNPGQEGDPRMLSHPEEFAPFKYRHDHLSVLQMDATNLEFPDNTFDFAFSLSSIEHFGSRENSKAAMREIYRVLKPSGVCCIATELILNISSHDQYFTIDELYETIIYSTDFKLVGGELDLSISRSLLNNPIDLDIEKGVTTSPHIVLKRDNTIWTSIMLFFQKII
jgi:ubiquinone/menaquinone biosynthesis C-methylase UbiE